LLPNSEKALSKQSLLAPIVVLALLGAALFLELKLAPKSAIFQQTKIGWQQLPAPAGYPQTFRASSSGTVWVLSLGRLSRWDGSAWRNYTFTDFGSEIHFAGGDFVVDGEQVWVPALEGVLHWDGERWRLNRETVAGRGASIVGGSGQVWVMDRGGTLAHFQEGQWHSRIWTDHPSDGKPKLARTDNDVVWAAWQGLWRFDGAKWILVPELPKDAELIGAAGDHLWFSDGSGLRSLSMDGKTWSAYPWAQTGLADDFKFYGVASAGESTWFAANASLVQFDGSLWRRPPLPTSRLGGIRAVEAGANGALWVLGLPPLGPVRTFLLYLTFVIPIAIIVVIVWLFRRIRQRRVQQLQLLAHAVQHATGETPEEIRSWRSGKAIAAEFVGTVVAFVALRRFWPQAPLWALPVIGAAMYLAVVFQQSLVHRKPKPSDPIGPGAPSRYDWGKAWKALAGALFLLVVFNADRLPMLTFLKGSYFWILVVAPIGYNAVMLGLMNAALRRGDYDSALNIIRWSHFYNPSGVEASRMSGHTLLLAGRYREAEVTLRRSLATAQARESYGSALEYLGDALMEQGRYDEATRSYEAALTAFPWLRRPYRGMAEMLLRQEKSPDKALEYIEKIVDFSGLSWRQQKLNGSPQDDYWALKAWALARLGRSSEAAQAIEKAVSTTAKNCLPDLATTHYRAGMAMQALGNLTPANEHFKKAVELDPHGRRGTLANVALREGSVWGNVRV
jgi:tetratricopeptide (TPR) repeat protein